MSAESQPVDAYAVVLADLRAKRDQIDQAIQAIEALSGGAAGAAMARPAAGATQTVAVDDPGAFLGMTIAEAAIKLLTSRRKTLTNAELVTAFKAGGLAMNSADAANTINSVLNRRFQNVGDIVRVSRGTWGLKTWYPNRNFNKDRKGDGDTAPDLQAVTSAINEVGLEALVEAVHDSIENPNDPNAPSRPSRLHPNVLEK
jgi:hypothetical protein